MNYRDELQKLLAVSDGFLVTEQVEKYGIPRTYLSQFVKEGLLERTSHGVYTAPETLEDEMHTFQYKRTLAIFSHETALYLHDLTDRDPFQWTVTVPRGYNTSSLKSLGAEVHTVKKELHLLGAVKVETIYGRPITAYNPERTLCDITRARNQMDPYVLNEAFKNYVRSNQKNVQLLINYAREFRVEKIVRNYLEILL